MEIGWNPETVLTAAGGATFIGVAIRKWMVQWVADRPKMAGDSAVAAQFQALQASIEANKRDTAELRGEVTRMDRTIHVQQRTITRMEMLLRQFTGLVESQGIAVPKHMQDEIDALLKADTERYDQ